MSDDEKRAWKAVKRAFWLMAVPMLAAFVFTCVRASANGGWVYYIEIFLIGICFPLASILIKNPYSSELAFTETELSWKKDLRFYFTTAAVYYVIEFVIFVVLMKIPAVEDMFYRTGLWDPFLILLLSVLAQNGILVLSSALKHLFPVLRLYRSVYNHENWVRYAETNIFTGEIASTYCMPRGREYQEVGIVLIRRWRKKDLRSEEYFYHYRRPVLFAPLFLVRSTTPIRPPDILFKPEHKGMLGLRFLGDGAALVKQSYANVSFNCELYTIRLRKILQVPTGWRKSLLPRLVFPGRRCPVFEPKK